MKLAVESMPSPCQAVAQDAVCEAFRAFVPAAGLSETTLHNKLSQKKKTNLTFQ